MVAKKKNSRSSRPNPESQNRNFAKISGIAFQVTAFNIIIIWGGLELNEYISPGTFWVLMLSIALSVTGTIYILFKYLNL